MATVPTTAVVYKDQLDGPVYIKRVWEDLAASDIRTCTRATANLWSSQPDIVDITRENPGRVYVGRLPGHDRPAFVRKKKSSCFRLPKLFDSTERTYKCVVRSPSHYRSDSHHTAVFTDQPVYVNDPNPRPLPQYVQLPPYPTPETGKHTCGACGKFRSPSYCKRHPLADGEQPKPSLCRKCAKNSTDSGSDDSYEKYRKEQKRRRRQRASSSDERWERSRRERRNRKKQLESGDYSYERFREEERYRGPRYRYSVDERSSYSDWEQKEPPRVIYIDRSSSQRHTRSSSGTGPSVVISYKSARPRKLRRSSRSRSSAEEIRVVRRVIERPERRPRAYSRSMSERSYRRHYRSASGSSAKSVHFRSPIRRYRGRGYDGEMASEEESDRASLRRPSEPTRLSIKGMADIDQKVHIDSHRDADPIEAQHHHRNSVPSFSEAPERPPSRTYHHVRGSSEIRAAISRYKQNQDGHKSSTTSLMSGTRGSSLSADHRAFQRARSRESQELGSRRQSRVRYGTPSDTSNDGNIPRTYEGYQQIASIMC